MVRILKIVLPHMSYRVFQKFNQLTFSADKALTTNLCVEATDICSDPIFITWLNKHLKLYLKPIFQKKLRITTQNHYLCCKNVITALDP